MPSADVPEQRAQVAWQPGGAQIEEREVDRRVGKPLREALELAGSAGDGLAGLRNEIVSVEHADTFRAARPQ
jgi:hypothetical protein